MHGGGQVGVVEVEDVRADAVQEGGVHDVEAFLAAEQSGLWGTGERGDGGEGDLDCFVVGSAYGDAHPVQQRAGGFGAGGFRQVLETGGDDVAGEGAGYVGRRGLFGG